MGESSLAEPRVVGRYVLFDPIASGGMATVYYGRLVGPAGFSRTVAIKRLHPQFARDPEFAVMFLDEARMAARIRHPNVVPTLDVVSSDDELFLVMEYVQGEALSRLSRAAREGGRRIPLPIVLRIATDVLQGLHAAHEARDELGRPLDIVHRDVSPQNVLVGVDGIARLLDFGVAKAAGRAHTTTQATLKGKLSYMPPEQMQGNGVTRQSDLYAFAVVLWELVTGARLFTGDSEADLIAAVMRRNVPRPGSLVPELPPALEGMILRGLAASPQERFPTAREMCLALAECGIPASAMTVGDWVHQTAAEALADRAQRVAALESAPSGTLRGVGPSDRPSTPRRPREPEIPIVADLGTQLSAVAGLEKAFRRGARLRVAAVVGALAVAVLATAALTSHRAAPPGSPPNSAADPPVAAPQATAPVVGIPAAQTPPELAASTSSPAPSPSAARSVRPPALARPGAPRRSGPGDEAVFESRQ